MGQEKREKKPTYQLTLFETDPESQESPPQGRLPKVPPGSPYYPLPGEDIQHYLRRVPGPVKLIRIEVPK